MRPLARRPKRRQPRSLRPVWLLCVAIWLLLALIEHVAIRWRENKR